LHRLEPALRGDDADVRKRFAGVDEFFQLQRALVADDSGGRLSKAGTDFHRRGGDDIVEPVADGFSILQPDRDLGALLRGKSRGEGGVALQIDTIDEAKDFRMIDLSIIVFFDLAVREYGSDAEGNAHLGLQRIAIRPFGIAAGITGGGFGDENRNRLDVLRCLEFVRGAQCGLGGGLREIAGRNRLVVDRHDLRLAAGEQLDDGGRGLAAVSSE
jgi:hypothetical protein